VSPFTTELVAPRCCIARLPRQLTSWRHLKVLDLGGNGLQGALAFSIGDLVCLESLNVAHNDLKSLPKSLGNCAKLRVLGLRSNALTTLPDCVGDLAQLESLFLTDNRLTELPATMGKLTKLRKLQAASNCLRTLPGELFEGALELEMVRVPCNRIDHLPPAMGRHPKLCWLSLAGNPAWCAPPQRPTGRHIPTIKGDDLRYDDAAAALGPSGASGGVFPATWRGEHVAVKRFVAGVSPDGAPKDEIDAACAVQHPCCVDVLAVVEEPGLAMVMALLHGQPLGGRPTPQSLLRCTYPPGTTWSPAAALAIATDVAAGCAACAAARVAHGDVYAHNVVVPPAHHDGDAMNVSRSRATLVDMGAAFAYPTSDATGIDFQRLEVRAFGLMLQELAQRSGPHPALMALAARCLDCDVASRPSFAELEAELAGMAAV
jgi:hypothetical protein